MQPLLRTRVRAAVGAAATVLVLPSLASCGGSGAAPAAPGPSIGQRMDAPLPAAVAHTVLVSSTGHRFDITQLLGTTVVISDMMTLCQETCPLDTADIVAAARAAAKAGVGRKITFLSITIDPARDTRTRLAAYRAMYRPAPKDWVLATAAPAALRRFWAALGTYVHRVSNQPPAPRDWLTHKPLTYDLTHSDEVYFVDSQGHERFLLEGAPHVTGNAPIPDRLRRFMDAIGRKNLRHSHPAAWTLPQELQVLSWLSGLNIGT